MLSIALGIGFDFGLILINHAIADKGRWIIFLQQDGGRICVTDLRLFLGVTYSPLV
jgi:hypothetical protein